MDIKQLWNFNTIKWTINIIIICLTSRSETLSWINVSIQLPFRALRTILRFLLRLDDLVIQDDLA